MSYDIIFNRLAIKSTTGNVMPLVLIGNSSLTERTDNGRARIVREWASTEHVLHTDQGLFCNPASYTKAVTDAIAGQLEKYNVDISSMEYGGLHIAGKSVTYKTTLNYLCNNVSHAIPIEEYLDTYGGFVIRFCVSESNTMKNRDTVSIRVETPVDFLEAERVYENLVKTITDDEYVSSSFYWIEEAPCQQYYNRKQSACA